MICGYECSSRLCVLCSLEDLDVGNMSVYVWHLNVAALMVVASLDARILCYWLVLLLVLHLEYVGI